MGDAFAGSAAFADSALTVLRVLLLASFHLVRVGVRDTDRVGVRDTDRDRDIVRVRVRVRERVRVRVGIRTRTLTLALTLTRNQAGAPPAGAPRAPARSAARGDIQRTRSAARGDIQRGAWS